MPAVRRLCINCQCHIDDSEATEFAILLVPAQLCIFHHGLTDRSMTSLIDLLGVYD